jgi:hypothetical protein
MKSAALPRRRTDGLLVDEIDGETIVYDLDRHKAHCLNRSAAFVWRRCDGRATADQVAAALAGELALPADTALVSLAIEQLETARLLERPAAALPERGHTRRSLIRKLGLTAAAAPLITSILAPTAAAGASVCSGTTSCTSTKICPPGKTCRNYFGVCTCRPND